MRIRPRRITVDGDLFLWRVARLSPNFIGLRIWAGEHRSRPWADIRCRFDDPWLHFGEILAGDPQRVREAMQLEPLKPRQVAAIIRQIRTLAAGEDRLLHFELVAGGELMAIDNAAVAGADPFAST